MDSCIVCDSTTTVTEATDDRAEKLAQGHETLQQVDIMKSTCTECGHISYFRDD